jgi:hypothetical protein
MPSAASVSVFREGSVEISRQPVAWRVLPVGTVPNELHKVVFERPGPRRLQLGAQQPAQVQNTDGSADKMAAQD